MASADPFEMPQELVARASDQIEVTLIWWEHDNRVAVSVVDRKSNQTLLVDVDGRDPLDVFKASVRVRPRGSRDRGMTLIWFVVWLMANSIGDHAPLSTDPVNTWRGTLIFAIALDLARQHTRLPRREDLKSVTMAQPVAGELRQAIASGLILLKCGGHSNRLQIRGERGRCQHHRRGQRRHRRNHRSRASVDPQPLCAAPSPAREVLDEHV